MPVVDGNNQVRDILKEARTIAVVGLSDKSWRDSYTVSSFMLARGYAIIPVNPTIDSVFGITAVPSLSAVKAKVDIVNVFRRPEFVPEIVEEAIACRFPTLWLQTGVVHEIAIARAVASGMNVIVDRCIRVAYSLLVR
jgi:predicted CoA-binding protein